MTYKKYNFSIMYFGFERIQGTAACNFLPTVTSFKYNITLLVFILINLAICSSSDLLASMKWKGASFSLKNLFICVRNIVKAF